MSIACPQRRALIAALTLAPMFPLLSACAHRDAPGMSDKPTNVIFLEDEKALLPLGERLRPYHPKGLQLTKDSEGWMDHLYNDAAGYCTVGYGHLCYKKRCDGRTPVEYVKGITETAGTSLLQVDMQRAQVLVQVAIPRHQELLNDLQYAALCDFVFNVGGGNFRTSTLLKVILDRQFERVPAQLRRWVLAKGVKYGGLVTRREREITLFFEGQAIPKAVPRAEEDLSDLDIQPV